MPGLERACCCCAWWSPFRSSLDGGKALLSGLSQPTAWVRVLELAGGASLLLGLWTPIGGVLLALSQAWLAFGRGAFDIAPLIAAAIAVSLIMLGPGAWFG